MQNASFPLPAGAVRRAWRTLGEVLGFAARRADEDRIAQVAGSLTFTTVLSLVPLITIVFAVLSTLPVFAEIQDSLRSLLLQNLMPESVSDSIFRYLNQFVAKARGLTLIGLLFLAATAVSTMLTIDRAFNTIWRVRRPRPLYQRVLVYWAILTTGPLVLGSSLTLTSYLVSASAGFVNRPSLGVAILIDFVPLLLLALAYAALYVYVPNRPVAWRDALVGGFAGAILFELAKRGFALYIARFPTYTAIYGALAALPIFLLWVYVSWLITLAGATLAAALPLLYDRRWDAPAAPGHRFSESLRLLRALQSVRGSPVPGLEVKAAADLARLDLERCAEILERMEAEGIVLRVRPAGPAPSTQARVPDLWMFTADPARIDLARLFRMFAFDGPRSAEIGFTKDDPLRAVVSATPKTTLARTLAEVL